MKKIGLLVILLLTVISANAQSCSGGTKTISSVAIVDRVFKTTFTRGLSYGPSKGLSKNDRVKETQSAYG